MGFATLTSKLLLALLTHGLYCHLISSRASNNQSLQPKVRDLADNSRTPPSLPPSFQVFARHIHRMRNVFNSLFPPSIFYYPYYICAGDGYIERDHVCVPAWWHGTVHNARLGVQGQRKPASLSVPQHSRMMIQSYTSFSL